MNITEADLSEFQKKVLKTFHLTGNYKSTKLVASLKNRYNYVLHSSLLSLYLRLGLKMRNISRYLSIACYFSSIMLLY